MPRILPDGQIDGSFTTVSSVQHSLTERLYAEGLATNVSDEAVLYRLEDKQQGQGAAGANQALAGDIWLA